MSIGRVLLLVSIALLAMWLARELVPARGGPPPGLLLQVEGVRPGGNVTASIFVVAMAPPSLPGDFVELYAVRYRGKPIQLPAAGRLGKVARAWLDTLRQRGSDVRGFETGLVVFVAVTDMSSAGKPKATRVFVDSISYRPYDIAHNKSILYTIRVEEGRRGFAKVERKEVTTPIPVDPAEGAVTGAPKPLALPPPSDPEQGLYCTVYPEDLMECWERAYYTSVDNLTNSLPTDYFTTINGKMYMKTPVIIIYNELSVSATLGVSVLYKLSMPSVSIYPTFEVGPDMLRAFKGETTVVPSVTIYKGSELTWGGQQYEGTLGFDVQPEQWVWGYFWGRPAMAIYRHFWEDSVGRTYDNEEYGLYAVSDLYIINDAIQGGAVSGMPAQVLMDMLFEGTDLQYFTTIYPPGSGAGSNTVLLKDIVNAYDSCGVDFEIGIPVGAIIATILTANPVAVTLASTVGVTISVMGGTATVDGGIVNYGDFDGGANVFEDIYVAVSKYQYSDGNCLYRVPVGLYVKGW